MTGSAKPLPKSAPRAKGKLTYRGVTLRTPAARPQFTIDQIKQAVEDAVSKHAELLASSK